MYVVVSGGVVIVIAGLFRSTFTGVMGPVVAQLLTASQTWWVPVTAVAFLCGLVLAFRSARPAGLS